MVVGHDGHHRRPHDIEDGQVMRLMELVKAGALRLAKAPQERTRIGHRPRNDLAHMLDRSVGSERGSAIGGEALEIEHGRPLLGTDLRSQFAARYFLAATRLGLPSSA